MIDNIIRVTELGYMGVGVKNLEEWKNFATSIVGMEPLLVDEGESDRCYLRMDYQHHQNRFTRIRRQRRSFLYLTGFQVAGAEEFSAMQAQLSAAGIKFQVGAREEAEERRVLEVLKLNDPGGNPIEIYHGPEVQFSKPFHPGRAMHGALQDRRRRFPAIAS